MLLALLSPRVRFGGAVKWVSVGLLLELCGHVGRMGLLPLPFGERM